MFSRSLYRQEALEATIAAFGKLATFELNSESGDHMLAISDMDERVADRLVDALCNHALAETIRLERAKEQT